MRFDTAIGPWAGLGVLAAYAAAALTGDALVATPEGRISRALRMEWTKLRTDPGIRWSGPWL